MPDLTQPQTYGTFPEGLLVTPADMASLIANIDNALGEIIDAVGGPNFVPAANALAIVPNGNGVTVTIGGANQIVIAQGRVLDTCPATVLPGGKSSAPLADRMDLIAIAATRVAGPQSEARVVRADAAPQIFQPFSGALIGGTLAIPLTAQYQTPPEVLGLVAVGNASAGVLSYTATDTTITITSTDPNDARNVNLLAYGTPTGANGIGQNLPLLVNSPGYVYVQGNNATTPPAPPQGYDSFATVIVRANAATIAPGDIAILFPTLPRLSTNLLLNSLQVTGLTFIPAGGYFAVAGTVSIQNTGSLNVQGPTTLATTTITGLLNGAGASFGAEVMAPEFFSGGSFFTPASSNFQGPMAVSGAITTPSSIGFGDGAVWSENGNAIALTPGAAHVGGIYFANAANNAENTLFLDAGGIQLVRGDLNVSAGNAIVAENLTVQGTINAQGASFGAEVTAPEFFSGGSYFTPTASHFQGAMTVTGEVTALGGLISGGALFAGLGATSGQTLIVPEAQTTLQFANAANTVVNTLFPDAGGMTLERGNLNVASGSASISGGLTVGGALGFADGATFFENGNGVGFTAGGNHLGGLYFSNGANNAVNTSFPDAGGIVLSRGSLSVTAGNVTAATGTGGFGSLMVSGNAVVSGATTLGAQFGSGTQLTVNGGSLFNGDLSASGNTTLNELTVNGAANAVGFTYCARTTFAAIASGNTFNVALPALPVGSFIIEAWASGFDFSANGTATLTGGGNVNWDTFSKVDQGNNDRFLVITGTATTGESPTAQLTATGTVGIRQSQTAGVVFIRATRVS